LFKLGFKEPRLNLGSFLIIPLDKSTKNIKIMPSSEKWIVIFTKLSVEQSFIN